MDLKGITHICMRIIVYWNLLFMEMQHISFLKKKLGRVVQKTKRELLDGKRLLGKIDHTEKWKQNVENTFKKLGITKNLVG